MPHRQLLIETALSLGITSLVGMAALIGMSAGAGTPVSGAPSQILLRSQNLIIAGEVETDQISGNSGIQGWTGSVESIVKPGPAAKPAKNEPPHPTEPAKSAIGLDEGNPNFQGWDSDRNAYRDFTAKEMSSLHNSLMGASGQQVGGSPRWPGLAQRLRTLHGPTGQ